jgi:hypothetical protein
MMRASVRLMLMTFAAALSGAPGAHAADAPAAALFGRKPYVAPPAPETPPSETQLKDKYLERLKRDFEIADTTRSGALTRAQVDGPGLSVIARHFDQIDTKRAGRVTFDQVNAFLRSESSEAGKQ